MKTMQILITKMEVKAMKIMVGQYDKMWEDDGALLSMSALKEEGVNAVKMRHVRGNIDQ
jgi:hypothetical protein